MSYDHSDERSLALLQSNQTELREEFEDIRTSLDDIVSMIDSINWLHLDQKIEKMSQQIDRLEGGSL